MSGSLDDHAMLRVAIVEARFGLVIGRVCQHVAHIHPGHPELWNEDIGED
ncbi:MAG: hypothetical protein AB7Q29_17335 [Vicinamibacterales bacterium]